MKKILFFATAAFLCCGSSSSFGQIQVLKGTPTLAPKLVATQSDFDGRGFASLGEEIANPFDLLGAPDAQPAPPPPAIIDATPAEISGDVSEDPQSLPVGRRHRRHGVVDTMANYGQIAAVPNAAQTPVDWCYGATRTPNPVAEVLLRQECVDGLWDGYAAVRAAECAHMWSKLTATKKCRGCQHCAGCSTGCASGGCASGACTAAPVNRYRNSCDTCSECAASQNAAELQQAAQMASAVGPAKSE